jgi:hypothetical protein
MSNLYIANTGIGAQNGVWKVSDTDYQYIYAAFTPGEDVNLDLVSIRTQVTGGVTTVSSRFQVGLYSSGSNSLTPGSLISYLSGPTTPTADAYNDYSPTSTIGLSTGNQYWLGFTLSSNDGANNQTRVRLGTNTGNFTTLGTGWSAQTSIYKITNGVATNPAEPLIYSLYGTPLPVCFNSGTLILIPDGSWVEIQRLKIGDLVLTADGARRIKWVPQRKYTKQALLKFPQTLPVRIQAGALGEGMPSTDLLVSRKHGLVIEGAEIGAETLCNGANITHCKAEEFPDGLTYYHIEFEEQEVLMANGCSNSSFVSTGNRSEFDNVEEYRSLYGDPDQPSPRKLSPYMWSRELRRIHKNTLLRFMHKECATA